MTTFAVEKIRIFLVTAADRLVVPRDDNQWKHNAFFSFWFLFYFYFSRSVHRVCKNVWVSGGERLIHPTGVPRTPRRVCVGLDFTALPSCPYGLYDGGGDVANTQRYSFAFPNVSQKTVQHVPVDPTHTRRSTFNAVHILSSPKNRSHETHTCGRGSMKCQIY